MNRDCLSLSVAIFFLCFVACSPIKGYPGPELPEGEISRLSLSYDGDEVEVRNARANGIQYWASGLNFLPGSIDLLPGKHLLDLQITLKDPLRDCCTYTRRDDSGYQSCLQQRVWQKDPKKRRSCNYSDYITHYRQCLQDQYDGDCAFSLNTSRGRSYMLHVIKSQKRGHVTIVDPLKSSPAGYGDCRFVSERTETITESSTGYSSYYAPSCDYSRMPYGSYY